MEDVIAYIAKSLVIGITATEREGFAAVIKPGGIFLTIESLRRLERIAIRYDELRTIAVADIERFTGTDKFAGEVAKATMHLVPIRQKNVDEFLKNIVPGQPRRWCSRDIPLGVIFSDFDALMAMYEADEGDYIPSHDQHSRMLVSSSI